jgi:hypothetical protein
MGKLAERLKEIRRLQEVLSQPNFEPEQILNSSHRRLIVVAAKELGEDSDKLIKGIAAQICSLAGFKEASAEKVCDAEAAKMTQLEEELEKERSKSNDSLRL